MQADPRLCFTDLCHATLSQSGLAPNSHILKSARMALAPRANPATPTTAQPSITRQQQPANSQQQPTDTNATHHNQEADPTSASSAAADGTAADALCSPACTWVDIQNLNSRVLYTLEAFPGVHQLQLVCEPRGAGVVARSVISRSAPGAGPPLPPWLRRVAKVAVTVAKVGSTRGALLVASLALLC